MSSAPPRGLRAPRVPRLLSRVRAVAPIGERVERLSALLLGAPYRAQPLVGSADSPEVFTASLDGFDCVTYVETVLALARASDAEAFANELRLMRYDGGRVDFFQRNHYMTAWVRRNAGRGVLARVAPPGVPRILKDRVLDVVPGLPARRERFHVVPKGRVRSLEPHVATGDVVIFGSTRAHLDVFHAGILVRDGDGLRMRHASRGAGGVVEEDLLAFVRAQRMSGLIVVRPKAAVERGGA